MSDFNVVSKSMEHLSTEARLDTIRDLYSYLENVFVIYDIENTMDKRLLNIYIYDGNFLRPSFEEELLEKSEDIMPTIYSLRSSTMVKEDCVGPNCHAHSILVKQTCPYMDVIDQMCMINKKFEYFNTVGGLVINHKIDRIQINKSSNKRIKKTFTDDSYAAFSFFMALFAQVFSPSKTLFSNEFVELIEEVNNKKVTYGKKHDVCCDGSVKITISYLMNRLDKLTYDEDEKRVPNVYDSVVDSFGVDFLSNSNGYYPKGGRKVYLRNT